MALNVYLIRHAETDFNRENSGFLQSDNIKLNPYGIIQLKDLSKRLAKIKFDRIYSSDLPRAEETVKFVFGKENKDIILDKRLKEYSHGSASPDSEEWKKKYKELLEEGLPREEIRPFGGENIWDLIKRVTSFLRDIEKTGGNIAIVAHSGLNETLINLSQKRKKEDFLKIKQDNACINHLKYERNEWEVLIINDTKHLENLKPEIEYYENIEEVNKKMLNFLKEEETLCSENIYAFGNLAKNKIGKYKRVFRRYFGTPIEITAEISNDKIKKDWKIVHLLEDYIEYEIGEIILKGVKYKINLVIPKDYNEFISKNDVKWIDKNRVLKMTEDKMKQKILSFVYNQKRKKFLLLNMTKHPDHAPMGGRFTVTGGIEKDESPKKAVQREIKEETGLDIEEIFSLNWGSVYNWKGEEFKEMNFISFVDSNDIILNEEHSGYEWLGLEEFVRNIDWNDNKELLKKVLERAIKKEVYFDKKERGQ